MHITELEGVLFIEGPVESATIISHTICKIHGIFSQSQLKNLNDVKRKLVKNVARKGGNCLINFKYGQKSTFWTTFLGIDNVNWYGEGDICKLTNDQIGELKNK